MKERLQKIIAQSGICSRRAAETLITAGKVTVNGRKVSLGDSADPARDRVCVDGKLIGGGEEKVYLMLYKPRGYVTTMSDEHGRKTVAELVEGCGARVVPVGRLDFTSEGLLLLTNDGALTHALTHPSHEVPKYYEVRVRGDLRRVEQLREPMKIDGHEIAPAEVYLLSEEENSAKIRIGIHEGRNRQIRKMCEQCGFEVRRLKRTAIGKLQLDPALHAGQFRALTPKELQYLQEITAQPQEL